MKKSLALSLLAAGGIAHADSRILVSHQMQSVWHGYTVFLDGVHRSDSTGNAKRITGVASGRHELSVNIVSSPFKPDGKPLCVGPIDVPDFSEVRIKCEDNGGITIIGTTSYGPPAPPPPPLEPPVVVEDPRGDADELLALASRQMMDAPPACERLRNDVYALRLDLASRRRGMGGRHRLAAETMMLADGARDVCPRGTVDLLRDASRVLAPYNDDRPPPPRPAQVNPEQFEGMRSAIAHTDARERIEMLRRVTRGSWFGTGQIGALLVFFPVPAARMVALHELAPRAVDPQNARPILDCFSTPGERDEAFKMLGR